MKTTLIGLIIEQLLFKPNSYFNPSIHDHLLPSLFPHCEPTIHAHLISPALLTFLMLKASDEMDLADWEILPDDGFVGFHHDHDDKEVIICPSPTSCHNIVRTSKNSTISNTTNQLVQVPIHLEAAGTIGKNTDQELIEQQLPKIPIVDIYSIQPMDSAKFKDSNFGLMVAEQDMNSRVFFKKVKENEFVDKKMNSPKSGCREITPPKEAGSIQFEEKEEVAAIEQEIVKQKYTDPNIEEESNWEEGGGGGLNIWRWRLSGIGALCFIGVVAATTCIFIFGSKQRNKYQHHNQKLEFQIYADGKKIKQVVQQETGLMNQAISAARGVPLAGAHIIFGALHHDGI